MFDVFLTPDSQSDMSPGPQLKLLKFGICLLVPLSQPSRTPPAVTFGAYVGDRTPRERTLQVHLSQGARTAICVGGELQGLLDPHDRKGGGLVVPAPLGKPFAN